MSALDVFCDILQTEMGLSDDQVIIWDQKFKIPPDERLYIAVEVPTPKPFGSSNRTYDDPDNGFTEEQSANFMATLSVDIYSRTMEALDRKEEVILALKSIYSQQQQALHGMLVAPLSVGFSNLSSIEGSAIPYRFNISVNIQYAVVKTKPVEYFDQFPGTLLENP